MVDIRPFISEPGDKVLKEHLRETRSLKSMWIIHSKAWMRLLYQLLHSVSKRLWFNMKALLHKPNEIGRAHV